MVAVSFAAILIKLLAEVPTPVIATYRLTLSSLLLTPLYLDQVKRGRIRRPDPSDLPRILLAGTFLALHFLFWISSLKHTSVASSVILVTTNPIFVGLFSEFFTREKPGRLLWFGILLSILGTSFIGFGDRLGGSENLLGDLLALLGAVAASGYWLLGRSLRQRLPLLAYVYPVYTTAALLLLVILLPSGAPLFGYTGREYLLFLALAVVPQLVGHTAFNWALRYLSPTFVTVTILGEPVGATILAFLILEENPGLGILLGGFFVLLGIFVASRAEIRRNR